MLTMTSVPSAIRLQSVSSQRHLLLSTMVQAITAQTITNQLQGERNEENPYR